MNAILNSTISGAPVTSPGAGHNSTGAVAGLAQSAILVNLSIKQWAGRKLDRDVSDELTSDKGAAKGAARVTKSLVDKGALEEIGKIAGRARTYHYRMSLPWFDSGTRIMTMPAYLAYVDEMRKIQDEFADAVAAFVAQYDRHVAEARQTLGDMFDADDYPTASEIRAAFKFNRPKFSALSDPRDFRANMSAAQLEIERAAMLENMQEQIAGAQREVFERVAEAVGHMAKTLAGFKPSEGKGDKVTGNFQKSLVENVRELVEVLPALNLTGDARINDLAQRMADLCQFDAKELKENKSTRDDIAAKAAAIVADVEGYF